MIRALLVRSTSTYVVNKDHDFLDDFTTGGGVEITVATYARKTLTGGVVNYDTVNDRAEIDFDNIAFGALETGQTVSAIIIYRQTGGDDLTPANDEILLWIDTLANGSFPHALTGAAFTVVIDDQGLVHAS